MRIPKSFLLKGNKWTVKTRKVVKDDDGDLCMGLTDPEVRTIYLCKEATDIEWVFWHEYGHALLHEQGVTGNSGGISLLAEELICDGIADALTKDKEIKFKRNKK